MYSSPKSSAGYRKKICDVRVFGSNHDSVSGKTCYLTVIYLCTCLCMSSSFISGKGEGAGMHFLSCSWHIFPGRPLANLGCLQTPSRPRLG